jgi:hypothetical protein
MACRLCGAILQPDLSRAGKTATSFASCVYRCESCQVGYSNARDEANRRALFASPALNVPAEVAEGLDATLASAFNVRARGSKRARFGSSESEDAVTWAVFRFLRQAGQLTRLAALCGLAAEADEAPSLLLWGSPISGPMATGVAAHLGKVCDALGESHNSRSEPDAMIAWPNLLIVIEAKTGSPNEILKGDARDKIDRYTGRPDLFSASAVRVRELGYYELVRNWRIAADLADACDIPVSVVVNLGPPRLRADVLALRQVLGGSRHRLEHLQWADLLDRLELPPWFLEYAELRGLARM